MAIRTIIKEGDPNLRKICRPVEKFDQRLWELLDDLKDTLDYISGLGL
ncbi:MAG: peptide deformylase, partial [Clostridia bacterium]|nr:peptide deformylase [Clostridia bacterium]